MLAKADLETVQSLSPRAVVAYLRSQGWDKVQDYGENAAYFASEEKTSELLVPLSSDARDFVPVMSILVSDLSSAEDRSPFDIIRDLSVAPFDVIQFRSCEADELGSIPLSIGVELHERARDTVLFAANAAAAETPRASWRGRPFEQVDDYVRSLRLAQSQRGSFVISFLSAWDYSPPQERAQTYLGFHEPFGRRATKALASALDATSKALKGAAVNGVEAFRDGVKDGVSSNFCQSLAVLARESDGIEVSVRWSMIRKGMGRPFLRLSREDAITLGEAAQKLSERESIEDFRLYGLVTQIKEEPGSFDGNVTVEGLVEGRLRRVLLTFDANDNDTRERLIDAFKRRSRIGVSGELQPHGARLRLDGPQRLEVIKDAD